MTLRADLQQVAKDALGEREGSVVVIEPATGAVQGDVELPELRPEPGRQPRLRGRPATCSPSPGRRPATRCWPTPTSSATCRARRSRCSPPASAWRTGVLDLSTDVPRRERVGAAADRRPDRELRGHDCAAATSPRCSPAAATSRSPRPPSTSAPSAMVQGVRRLGRRRAAPDRPAPAGGQHVRRHRRPGPEPAAAGDPRLRPERGPDGAAAHGDGRRHRRQRRPDDEALRRRRRRSTTTARVLDQTPARGLEDADLAGRPPSILQRPDDQRRRDAARRAAASPSTAASRSPPRPAPPSSTAPASRSGRTPGSSPSPRPTPRSTRSP